MTSLIERTTGVTEPAQLASFAIARTGSISSNVVEELNLTETVSEISSIFFYETKLQELAESLELILYSLVPATGDDRNLRQRILLMKRNIHNNRLWPEAAQDIALVTPFLIDPGHQRMLAEWFET